MFFKRNTDDPLDSVPTRRPGALLYVRVPFCAETRRFSGGDSRTRTYDLRVMRTGRPKNFELFLVLIRCFTCYFQLFIELN